MSARDRHRAETSPRRRHAAPVDEPIAVDGQLATDGPRAEALRKLGLTGGTAEPLASLGTTLKSHGLSWYPLVAVGLLAIVDSFQRYGFAVLTPDISRTLGVDKGAIAAAIAAQTVAISIAPLPIAALAQRHARRAFLCLATGFLWSLFAIGTGFVTLIWGLVAVLVANGISTGSVHALHQPLLWDVYPPQARVRVLSSYQFSDTAGNVIAPLLVAALAVAGLTWRGTFVAMGVLSLLVVATAIGLRDPGYGRWDERMIRRTVRGRTGETPGDEAVDPRPTELGFFEITRRLMLIPTVRRMLVGYAMFGVLLIPFQTFLFFFLEERWNMGAAQRGLFFAYAGGVAMVALALFGRRAERAFQRHPPSVTRIAGGSLAAGVVLIALGGLAPWFWLMLVMFGGAFAGIILSRPAIFTALLGVIPAYMRPHASALAGVFLGGVGGVAGAIFLTGMDSRFGVAVAMASLLVPGLLAAFLLVSAGKFVTGDLERMVDEIVEDEQIRELTASGERLPMLACRSLDFSYGPVQVLFDVDFTVEDGEMVALLGVNGAGKSTLLRAISGTGLPSAGSVRFRGADITYLDAERRVRLGIGQVPGGRAVFGPMTVHENLRGMAFTLGRDTKRVNEAIDRCFEVFPRLAERRNQRAATLSGGEQQMLGLSKALILEPRLLLIDELSLGLAPIIVADLLEMVREINARGTAVVLVEQSVNIALSLVDHAYFMEQGEIRFDGPSAELLARDDLLRAVFLEGAAARERR